MKNRVILGTIFLGMLIGASGCGGNKGSKFVVDPYPVEKLSQATYERYLQKINQVRQQQRTCDSGVVLGPVGDLNWSDKLHAAAAEHNADMMSITEGNITERGTGGPSDHTARVNHLGHPSSVGERLLTNDYPYSVARQNVLAGGDYDTLDDAVDAWLAEPVTCKRLMDANVTEMGLAHDHNDSSTYVHYWTIELAKPAREPKGYI
jgi:uncharacterized protein YkwD